MGRPSFKIDRQRLRGLRDERGLSQADLASALCERLGLDEQDPDTSTASYRRIEARGRTSRKRAEAIAQILDVTLAELEGIVPPDTGIWVIVQGCLTLAVFLGLRTWYSRYYAVPLRWIPGMNETITFVLIIAFMLGILLVDLPAIVHGRLS